ncbi:MAG: ABC transporter permease [Micromonosporaceae bacterium]
MTSATPGQASPGQHNQGGGFRGVVPPGQQHLKAPVPSLFTPSPGAAPIPRMIAAQAMFDARGVLRNGEQLLLTLIIPVLLLTGFSEASVLNLGHGRRVDFLAPGIFALAIMSTAFTSQAIATGFERRYGVLKRLGATPLSRGGLVAARTVTVLAVEVMQFAVIAAVAAILGWRPHGGWSAVAALPLLVLTGTAAFTGLALLMAGTLRAEATLAAANLVYLVLLGLGGVMFPLTKFPPGMRGVLSLLPISALSGGTRSVLQYASGVPWRDLAVLTVWAVVGIALAARTFRWE